LLLVDRVSWGFTPGWYEAAPSALLAAAAEKNAETQGARRRAYHNSVQKSGFVAGIFISQNGRNNPISRNLYKRKGRFSQT
jgi:hypothetical protein